MKLYLYDTSPYGRKVMIAAKELGLWNKIKVAGTSTSRNPLGKSPVLLTDDGLVLQDSPVICAYLDGGRERIYPPYGSDRWRQLALEALADGAMDSALIRMAVRRGAATGESAERGRIERVLDVFEAQSSDWDVGTIQIGQIAVAALLSYMDLRFASDDWSRHRPALKDWYSRIRTRPSMEKLS